jgi:glycosyltransferase involved in cell wall biosynthesis
MSVELSVLVSIFKGEAFLPLFLDNLAQQSLFLHLEVILVANEPSPLEKETLAAFKTKFADRVKLIEVSNRESLGASWNRAWSVATAPCLAIWNIDDRRAPDSLERQLGAISQSDWAICYGDYVRVGHYGDEAGVVRATPEYSPRHFARSFAQGGAFWVLRRDLNEKAGFFDEQFSVAADMDYSLRVAGLGLRMGKANGILGYFTDSAQGLSTRDAGRQAALERTAVQLRYGVYDKVDPALRTEAAGYRIDAIQSFGKWRPLAEYLPDHEGHLRRRSWLWAVGRTRYALRGLFAKMGILNLLHRIQVKVFGREI